MLTRVKTFDDGRCVDKISPAQHAHEVRVELGDLYPGRPVHFVREEQDGDEEEEATTTTEKKIQPVRKKRTECEGVTGGGEDAWTVAFGAAHGTPFAVRWKREKDMEWCCCLFGCCLFGCAKATSSLMQIRP